MINRIIIMGRLTADPEYKQTPNGTAVATFTVAVDRNYTAKGQEKQTDFIPCVAWRTTADFIRRYFGKGNMIALDGSLQTRKYTDKQGNHRSAFEVVVDQVSFAGSKSDSTPTAAAPQKSDSFDFGDLGEFEELGADEGMPF